MLLSSNVVYKKRALPLCWLIVKGKKGHLAEATPIQLAQKVAPLLPAERAVVFLGDGEFDGTQVACHPAHAGLELCGRAAKNVLLTEARERFQPTDLLLQPGDRIELPEVGLTASEYGQVRVSIVWESTWKEPLILVSNLDFLVEAYGWYQRRVRSPG